MSDGVIDLNGSLDWEPFDIPGGSEPVALVRLRSEADTRAFTVLVRFPEGWKRPAAGSYEAAEDVALLDGTLEINDRPLRGGEWAYMQERFLRRVSIAREETLALARFSGPARWIDGEDGTSEEPMMHRTLTGVEAERSPLGGHATMLRAGTPASSWLTEAPIPGNRAPVTAELLDLPTRRWAFIEEGEAFPDFTGPCFCRTFGPGA